MQSASHWQLWRDFNWAHLTWWGCPPTGCKTKTVNPNVSNKSFKMFCHYLKNNNNPSVFDWAVFTASKRFTLWNHFHLGTCNFGTIKKDWMKRKTLLNGSDTAVCDATEMQRGRHCIACKMFCHKRARQKLSLFDQADFTASKSFTP